MDEFDAIDEVMEAALEMMAGRRGWSVGFNVTCGHITAHHTNGSVIADAAMQPGLWIVHTTAGHAYSKRDVVSADLAAFLLNEMRRVEDSTKRDRDPVREIVDSFPY